MLGLKLNRVSKRGPWSTEMKSNLFGEACFSQYNTIILLIGILEIFPIDWRR